MSKIGEKPIEVPDLVEVTIESKSHILVKGPKGQLGIDIPHEISVTQEGNIIRVMRSKDAKKDKSFHGLVRSLIANAVYGVSEGWSKRLEVVGTGYNVKMQGKDLVFKVGYSHLVEFKADEDITFSTEGNNICIVSGINKQRVGEIAHRIKSIRKPDPYKGKGIRYEGEYIKLKPGKKAKV